MNYGGKENQLSSLIALRGVACMLVCLGHLVFALDKSNWFAGLFEFFHQYGKFGVQIFFVISGFVIPLSLERSGYTLKNYFTFLYKRFLRLHPPYLLALIITYVISYFAYKVTHESSSETVLTFIKSLFYLHIPATNPVFWTLAVEAQYYFFTGLYFIMLVRFNRLSCFIVIPLLLLLSWYFRASNHSFLGNLVFFLIGSTGFMLYEYSLNKILNLLMLSLLIIFSFLYYEFAPALMAALTIIIILFYKGKSHPAVLFFGSISYSLYLLHYPIGIKLINLVKHKINPSSGWLLLLFTLGVVTAVAWLFYKYVETYSENLSRKIKYKKPLPVQGPYSAVAPIAGLNKPV